MRGGALLDDVSFGLPTEDEGRGGMFPPERRLAEDARGLFSDEDGIQKEQAWLVRSISKESRSDEVQYSPRRVVVCLLSL